MDYIQEKLVEHLKSKLFIFYKMSYLSQTIFNLQINDSPTALSSSLPMHLHVFLDHCAIHFSIFLQSSSHLWIFLGNIHVASHLQRCLLQYLIESSIFCQFRLPYQLFNLFGRSNHTNQSFYFSNWFIVLFSDYFKLN